MQNPDDNFAAFDAAWNTNSPSFFAPNIPVYKSSAHGRLDVLGGIADYSGSLVVQMPLEQVAICGVQRDDASGGAVTARSANATAYGFQPEVILPAEVFTNPVSLLKWLRDRDISVRWAGYLAGCISLLRAEGLIPRRVGARFYLSSDVPVGVGLASSAAVVVASMRAACAAFGVTLSDIELTRLCQRVETDVIDVPAEIKEPMTSVLGNPGELFVLLCQPYTVQPPVTLPDDWCLLGVESKTKSPDAANLYARVRVAAFMGYKILSDRAKSGFGGYLCNVTPADYTRWTATDPLPETMSGAEFLAKYGGIFDTLTTVEPTMIYPIRAATEHPIYENQRVHQFLECVRDGSNDAFRKAGELMRESNRSYSACGLGTSVTDSLVEIAQKEGNGVAGAKITGNGAGGTVCILTKKSAAESVLHRLKM